MYYSYVMGIDNSIFELKNQGFVIEHDGNNFMVSFEKEKAPIWEVFISGHLEFGYWNEYLTEDGVVFLFHLEDGIKRYEVHNFKNDEVLALCEKLCECKFESIKSMLVGNHFYKNKLGRLDIKQFSNHFTVKKMNAEDAQLIYNMTSKNLQYYEHCGRMNTLEDIYNDMEILPPGKDIKDKYYAGYFDGEELVAVMDFIDGFPDGNTAYIGFFMMNIAYQGKGIGTQIIEELFTYLKTMDFTRVQLGYDKGNPQSSHFWKKQHFVNIREVEQDGGIIVAAEREL